MKTEEKIQKPKLVYVNYKLKSRRFFRKLGRFLGVERNLLRR